MKGAGGGVIRGRAVSDVAAWFRCRPPGGAVRAGGAPCDARGAPEPAAVAGEARGRADARGGARRHPGGARRRRRRLRGTAGDAHVGQLFYYLFI